MRIKNYQPLKKSYFLVVIMTFLSLSVFAQNQIVTGIVTDVNGIGIPGVSIQIVGTSLGASSDAEGKFQLSVSKNSVLKISSVGYKSKELTVGNNSSLSVQLVEDFNQLNEVVVTGYSIDNRRETAGAVSVVNPKDLSVRPSGNIEQQLQGRVAGVTVVTNGQPGTSSQVRIRGFGSFGPAGSNNPLYVVDGNPVTNVDFLNPDDIENVTVLKDAGAASIYGSRAANGVIVYTTKRGNKGAKKLSVTYDGLYGMTNPGPGQKMLNPTDFANWTWQAYKNSNITPNHPQFGSGATPVIPDYINVGGRAGVSGQIDLTAEKAKYNIDPTLGSIYQVVEANKTGTDWYKEITRNAPVTRHTLGFSGGGDNSRVYVSLGAQLQDGILLANSFKRYDIRVNTEFDILKNVRVGENIQVTYRQTLGQTGGSGGQGIAQDENDILQAFRMPSIIPVYDKFGGYAGTAAKGFNNPRNPVANREGQLNNRSFNAQIFGNVYAEWEIIPDLTFRSTLNGFFNNTYYVNYSRLQYENSENNSAFGFSEGANYNFNWTNTNLLTFKRKFSELLDLNLFVGYEALIPDQDGGLGRKIDASGLNPFSYALNYVTLRTVSASGKVVNSDINTNRALNSIFARANVTFKNKYIFSGIFRRDGSSVFKNQKYGIFPAVSFAWRLSDENFMRDITWISDLKLRGGYGTMGNQNPVHAFNQYYLFSTSNGISNYDINGSNSSVVEGIYQNRIGNPDAKWETAVSQNIGFDGNFFNGRLDVVLDFWKKENKDLLLQLPLEATNGYLSTAPTKNVGKMLNQGIDILLASKGNLSKDLEYNLTFTGGFLKNEITYIADGLTYISGINPSYRGLAPIRNQLGQSISAFYGYKVIGLFQSSDEVASAPKQAGAAAGRFRYADLDGDGEITIKDRTYLGSPVPKFTAGFTFGLNYKNFDFIGQLNGFFGNKIFNASKWFTDFFPSFQGAAISERVKQSWTPGNTSATIPIFETAANFSTNQVANSFYIENGDYVRLQTIGLGYTFDQNVLSKLSLNKLRVYVTGNNLLTITKYQGLDPGVGGNADTQFGIDVGNYPITSSWTVGVNVGF
ncbi:MAG: hypothetical protein RIR51_1868 [Bacteroidota bacterium]|jgi:TonB-linked SusC/RagA family outer membrane protein